MKYNLYQSILVDTGIRVQLDVVPLCMHMYVYVCVYIYILFSCCRYWFKSYAFKELQIWANVCVCSIQFILGIIIE